MIFFQKIEEDIFLYSKDGNILLAGDFNAKTDAANDYVSDIQDDHSLVNNIETYNFDSPLQLRNEDKRPVDAQGEKFLSLCKNCRIRILNGRTKGDRSGKFTRYPLVLREYPSTLDYMITNTELLHEIESFMVLPHCGISDHECLSVSLNAKGFYAQAVPQIRIIKEEPLKLAKPRTFLLKLKSLRGKENLQQFIKTHERSNETTIDEMYSDLVSLISSCSKEIRISSGKQNGNKRKLGIDKKTPFVHLRMPKT